MATRPPNYCRDCGAQWYPIAGAPPLCPGCRSPNVAPVMSLNEPEPAAPPPERSSALPKVLTLVALGAVFHIVAGTIAVSLFRDDPAPRHAEVAAAKAAKKEPEPVHARAPKAVPRDPNAPAPRATPRQPDPPAPIELLPKLPEPTPVPTPPEPAPKPPEPAPRTLPEPPALPFPPPAMSWVSSWEKAGDVRVRVAGVAATRVPLEARKRKFLSPEPYLVVWVEVENTSKADHTYRRWQPATTGDCTLRYSHGGPVLFALYPPESNREWFSEFTQPLAPGGPPTLESLVFSRPDPMTPGDLTLILDATRVGATGRFSLTIPNAVWAKR